MTFPCLICGKQLESALNLEVDEEINQPYDAQIFVSHGHYGATLLDEPDGGTFLEVNICSSCLRERADRIWLVKPTRQTSFAYKPLRTKSGELVTEEMVERLAAEAEAGYDPAKLRPRYDNEQKTPKPEATSAKGSDPEVDEEGKA